MAEVVKAAERLMPKFTLGKKQVFLPNHVITLLRKVHLPPNEACFKVPLRFTKLDLRDYLWNVYNVEVTKVRAYVKELPLAYRVMSRAVYRPRPHKIMTVELAKPFQWPEVPEDLRPWNNELWQKREDALEAQETQSYNRETMKGTLKSRQRVPEERKDLAKLAKQMLAGEVEWSNDVDLDPRWEELLKKKATKNSVDAAAVELNRKTVPETSENQVKRS